MSRLQVSARLGGSTDEGRAKAMKCKKWKVMRNVMGCICACGVFACGEAEDANNRENNAATYDPCANKSCGDSCLICDPADSSCVETEEPKRCGPDGRVKTRQLNVPP